MIKRLIQVVSFSRADAIVLGSSVPRLCERHSVCDRLQPDSVAQGLWHRPQPWFAVQEPVLDHDGTEHTSSEQARAQQADQAHEARPGDSPVAVHLRKQLAARWSEHGSATQGPVGVPGVVQLLEWVRPAVDPGPVACAVDVAVAPGPAADSAVDPDVDPAADPAAELAVERGVGRGVRRAVGLDIWA